MTLTNHQRCQALRRRGLSIGQIARAVSLSRSTVHWHVKGLVLTSQQREGLRAQKRALMAHVNAKRRGVPIRQVNFRKPGWSKALVHLVAHLSFDGRVDRYGCQYYSRSREQAAHVQQLLDEQLGVKAAMRLRPNGIWVVSCYNVQIAAWLSQKERELLKMVKHSLPWGVVWLKALFDDEGHVYFSGTKRRIRASQNDIQVLERAQLILNQLGIASRLDLRARAVEISGRQHLLAFRRRINFSDGLAINPNRKNGLWQQPFEKRALLDLAMQSYARDAL